MISNCAEHPVNAECGVTGISVNMKEMPPIDMPGMTGDVVNDTQGHTQIATGDVVNVLPSRNNIEDQDLGEAGGVINTNPIQIDLGRGWRCRKYQS